MASAVLVLGLTTSALADRRDTGGTADSTTYFTTGSTRYIQDSDGDDLAFTNARGISVDMRWRKCSTSTVGGIKYDIAPGRGYRTLGTNFRRLTCLNIDYRGFIQTGSFTGTTFWNWSWE